MDLLDLQHLLHLLWIFSPLLVGVSLSGKLFNLVIWVFFAVNIEDAHSVLVGLQVAEKIQRASLVSRSSSLLLEICLLISLLDTRSTSVATILLLLGVLFVKIGKFLDHSVDLLLLIVHECLLEWTLSRQR